MKELPLTLLPGPDPGIRGSLPLLALRGEGRGEGFYVSEQTL